MALHYRVERWQEPPKSTNIRKGEGSEISKAISSTRCVWRIFTLEEAISVLEIYFNNFIKKNKTYYFPQSTHSVIGVNVVE